MSKWLERIGLIFLALIMGKLLSFSTHTDPDDKEFLHQFNSSYEVYALTIPDDLDFAGEKVPLRDMEVYERFDRELLVNTYWQSNTLLMLKRAHKYFPIIEPILKKHGVPDDFKYLAVIESGLQNVVSPAGATGYWQLMEATAKERGLMVDKEVDERYHIEKSTEAACKYLLEAKRKFGSWTLAAASFNMGMGGLERQMERQGVDNYYDLLLNNETSRYVFRVIAVKNIMTQPEKYGYKFRKKDLYVMPPIEKVKIDSAVANWAEWASAFNLSYKTLKTHNPWLRQSYLTNADSAVYTIWIPKGGHHSDMLENDWLNQDDSLHHHEFTEEIGDSIPEMEIDSMAAPIDSTEDKKRKKEERKKK